MRPSAAWACFDEILGVGRLGQIGGNGDDLAAGGFGDFGGGLFQRSFAPRADRDVDAFAGERPRDRLADAFAAAGDQRRLSGHSQSIAASPVYLFHAAPGRGAAEPTALSAPY